MDLEPAQIKIIVIVAFWISGFFTGCVASLCFMFVKGRLVEDDRVIDGLKAGIRGEARQIFKKQGKHYKPRGI